MNEKPQKRLVSKGRYAWSIAGRTTFFSMTLLFSLLGTVTLFFAVIQLLMCDDVFLKIFLSALVMFGLATYFYRSERKVERVTPITRHTVDALPAAESLVRASDAHSSLQQAELLRPVRQGNAAAPEELLRASINEGDALP